MAYGLHLEAEYEDGYTLVEDAADRSPFDEGRNTFHAIVNHRPTEHGHGRLVRFAAVTPDKTYTVEWEPLWEVDNPRPVYYREMHRERSLQGDWDSGPICDSHFFGFQYNAPDGANVKEVQQIKPSDQEMTP